MSELCAAFGCPMLGTFGSSGKWYCGCHFNAEPALNDAISAELNRLRPEVERIIALRRAHTADASLEYALINSVKDAVNQSSLPLEQS
jgi:hypothetical protein